MSSHAPRIIQTQIPSVMDPGKHFLMNCYEWGDVANERAVVCVHGLTRCGRDFDFLALALAQRHRVISVDVAGRGLSEWLSNSQEYRPDMYVQHLLALLEQRQVRQMDWVGTSMGGIIGMILAATQPERIGKLVLNDIGAFVPAESLKRIGKRVGVQMHFDTRQEAEEFLRAAYASFGIRAEWQWLHIFEHSLKDELDGSVRLHCDPAISHNFAAADKVEDINLWPLWEQISHPVLLIRGATSDVLPKDTADKMLATHSSMKLHEVDHAGHAPSLMDEEEIEVIAEFLAR